MRKTGVTWPVAMGILAVAAIAGAQPYEGFGASTTGGAAGEIVRVTTLADSGPGSLRTALKRASRTIVFEVGGEIKLARLLIVSRPFITIDGSTAPAPGITLTGWPLAIQGRNAHDIIVRDIRARNAKDDCLRVTNGATRVVLDHVSTSGCGDGGIDITKAHDVTVSWSLLADPASDKNMLIKYRPSRITLHHNLFVKGIQRNPQVSLQGERPPTDTTLDMRNNVVWGWEGGYGTFIMYGPWANVVGNYYGNPGSVGPDRLQGLLVCRGDGTDPPESAPICTTGGPAVAARVFASGNLSAEGVDYDSRSTVTTPFPAPPVTTQSACEAAHLVVQGAGARPTDAIDAAYRALVTAPGC